MVVKLYVLESTWVEKAVYLGTVIDDGVLAGNISKSILDNRLMSKKKLSGKVQEIMAKIEDHKIKAPFDGYTGIRNFSEGSFVKPGDVITELHDIKTLKIQVYIPESFSNKVN